MKINTLVKKSALAVAISAASISAYAGTHTVDAEGQIVLANEIFGAGSEDTLIAVPNNTYAIDDTGHADLADGVALTVKYTLDKGAVFGEDLSDISKWADANATLVFNFVDGDGPQPLAIGGAGSNNAGFNIVEGDANGVADTADYTVTVDQGGAIGDNTVTFSIVVANGAGAVVGADALVNVQVGGFRVKNLTSALERGVANPQVSLGAEYRNVTTAETDTQTAVVVLSSQDGVELTGTATVYSEVGGSLSTERARIDVADTELSFTGATDNQLGLNAGQDFDSGDNVGFVQLGDLQVVRTEYDGLMTNGLVVKKENGDAFDFQGSDQAVITLTSTATLDGYSSIYLRPAADGNCTATAAGTDFAVAPQAGSNSVNINLQGETTVELGAGYSVCAVADGQTVVPESTFGGELNVSYFNPRYTESQDTLEYGQLLRNGCQVTLFNLPNVNAADNAFVRLTNVSELPGAVRAFIWTQDGQQIDVNSELTNSLAAHATAVFHTKAGLNSGVFLGDAMPTYGAITEGRHRLVVQGAFPACEALGLVRSSEGILTNMTSTTYSGDDSRLGTEQSNTSNSTN